MHSGILNNCQSKLSLSNIGGGTREAMGAIAPLKSNLKGLSPTCRLVESCLSYNKPGSKYCKTQTQKINSYKAEMTKVSAFWQERYTPLPTPIPYCQQGAGVFEKLAPLGQKQFLRQCILVISTTVT